MFLKNEGGKMQKNYYAIIPADVRYDEKLTPNAKLLYGEITALCNEKGYCWANNQYFSNLYGVSKTTISKWINQLIKRGYVHSEIKYKTGTKEIEGRYLKIINTPIEENDNRYLRKVKDPIEEKLKTPIEEKLKDNNTVINTTFNNTLDIPYVEIVNYLNEKTGKNFLHTTKKTKELIKARWNEGFRLEHFKRVIDIKTADWKNNKKMNKFLRPQTLFGTNFESYLNEEVTVQKDYFDPNKHAF